ncbi:hypothetical protein D3H55_03005 [Bacillus salacetis]|uniref:Uncharacterized protein n=1 Tax=Bacillus salacetis TaxID=2315464 RepID=A0A3A1R635_9BACI|nr:hypothetical protein [Bacillus salacetis]RIW38520.1 hypothetical protein D3H55_03005 [Bacillus salacetis]
MYLYLGFAVLLLNLVFLLAKWLTPESELLNSFKKTSHFWWTQVALFLVSIVIISAHYYGLSKAEWYTSPMFEMDSMLYTGEKNGPAIQHEEFPYTNSPFETEVFIPGSSDGEAAVLNLTSKKGKSLKPITVRLNNQRAPLLLKFPENGLWKITINYDKNDTGPIVVEVK